MRLKKLKLSGFKSFVDPTTITFPGQLVGIVGPNGCGKSNTIDAVRWVMGESSAKHLRGESMADVIFNGSQNRKPVGQASVELVFDNNDGKLGGEYGAFAEISVKRQVSRDGQSQYFLNGSRCRRKDILDIILGTGVGPRSYAIIEQGTISRLIEARPEELRYYLEEVAGIAKYKERRKETENRIKHTRENLERLEDIREELGKQLDKLEKQAATAERYHQFKSEHAHIESELKAIKWKNLEQESQIKKNICTELSNKLEEKIAVLRETELQRDKSKIKQEEISDSLSREQESIYKINANVTSLEQEIKYLTTAANNLKIELENINFQVKETTITLENDKKKIAEKEQEKSRLVPKQQELEQAYKSAQTYLQESEEKHKNLQKNWDTLNHEANKRAKNCEVEKTKLAYHEKHLQENDGRLATLEEERKVLENKELSNTLRELREEEQLVTKLVSQATESLTLIEEKIRQEKSLENKKTAELTELQGKAHALKGKQASLEALQETALGRDNSKLLSWLKNNNLEKAKTLASSIIVKEGWDKAVEVVLEPYLQAICLENINSVCAKINDITDGSLSFLEVINKKNVSNKINRFIPLLQKIESAEIDISALCANIYCVNNLEEGLQLKDQLQEEESLVTPEGYWLGKNWLIVKNNQDEKRGIIAREKQLKQCEKELNNVNDKVNNYQEEINNFRFSIKELEQKQYQQRNLVNETQKNLANISAQIKAKESSLLAEEQRLNVVIKQIEKLLLEEQEDKQNIKESRAIIETLVEEMADDEQNKINLSKQLQEQNLILQETRKIAAKHKENFLTEKAKLESTKQQLDTLQVSLARLEEHYNKALLNKEKLNKQYEENLSNQPQLQEKLNAVLQNKLTQENLLSEVRNKLEEINQEIKTIDSKKVTIENEINLTRNELEEKKLNYHSLQTRMRTIEEDCINLDMDLQKIVNNLPKEAEEILWQDLLNNLKTKIDKLGSINLAAIDEFKLQTERKEHLDKQYQDLHEALSTLETAIAKIDKETKSKFKETFDAVNNSVMSLFPKMFGGGEAYLELTEHDLLNAGVTIMAKPPGKKNSTIHLLSGGEKALTAIALVFSLFKLNPAPFCMLDEVDAPLDDANVNRFTKLVKEMSKSVQFIVITHNKITMEMAEQLMGVTMREPGVSRIVSVDIEQAAEMVDG